MKKFEVSNPSKFTGSAAIYYNPAGLLCEIDCRQAGMTAEVIQAFKAAVPSTLELLRQGRSFGAGTTVVEVGYRISFDDWWKHYDKKINRARCLPLWDKLTDSDTVQCYEGTTVYNAYIQRLKVRQKLDPENYLKFRSWENEWK